MSELPDIDQYILAQPCRRCYATPGQPCNVYGRRKFHTGRVDAGARHYHRDLLNRERGVLGPHDDTLDTPKIRTVAAERRAR